MKGKGNDLIEKYYLLYFIKNKTLYHESLVTSRLFDFISRITSSTSNNPITTILS